MQCIHLTRAALTLSTLAAAACQGDVKAPAYDGRPYGSDESAASADDSGGYGGGGYGGGGSATAGATDIVLLRDSTFDGYLADSDDRALYMFASDVPFANTSACTDACLEKWPAFDAKDISVDSSLATDDFSRFKRADGTWQTAYKGFPLYYFTMDGDTGEVSGDGASGRWFVARDYFAFLGAKSDLTPEGATETAPFLTNRGGRTSYVFMNDKASLAGADPEPACTGACLDAWPLWPAPPSLDDLILPSTLRSTDFAQFSRTVNGKAVNQLTYRGWPLYYFAEDDLPGETAGHLMGAWRAIDPLTFAATDGPGVVPGSGY